MVDKKLSKREFIFRNFYAIKAFIPSSINETDLKTIQQLVLGQDFESYDKFLLGLGYEHRFSKVVGANQPFSNFKDAYEPRPLIF
jgi:iron complex outermembrane receptor protein